MKPFIFISIFHLLFLLNIAEAQQTLQASEVSEIIVSGTSTLHDWEANAEEIQSNGQFTISDNQIENIQSLEVKVPVESLKSGKRGMDKNMYEALKSEDHPSIVFQLKNVKPLSAGKISASGNLTIAGTSKSVELEGSYDILSSNKVMIKGSTSFNMTKFDVEPPTAMLGTIKTGDEITISYQITYQ